MNVEVRVTKNFKKKAKSLIKKYPSFLVDLKLLEEKLIENPMLGEPLGKNLYKIRLRISAKGRGKSGGGRVITYLENEILAAAEISVEQITVNLLTVYDKSERETISDKELKAFIKNLEI
jgi:mRNA-degrading endonuclease RelE of RelBE toxin-antitoxin system